MIKLLDKKIHQLKNGVKNIASKLNQPQTISIGLEANSIMKIAKDYDYEEMIKVIPRGTYSQLLAITSYGAIIADLGCDPDDPDRLIKLKEAAIFNAAIALIDTVIDEMPNYKETLISELDNQNTVNRLFNYNSESFKLTPSNESFTNLFRMIDDLICSIGRRFEHDKKNLNIIAELIKKMFNSEIGVSKEIKDSKVLPVLFIGILVNASDKNIHRLYNSIGELISMYDDLIDMRNDYLNNDVNVFMPSRFQFLNALAITSGFRDKSINQKFQQTIHQALEYSKNINGKVNLKTICFIKMVLNV